MDYYIGREFKPIYVKPLRGGSKQLVLRQRNWAIISKISSISEAEASELLENFEMFLGITWTVMSSAGLNFQQHTSVMRHERVKYSELCLQNIRIEEQRVTYCYEYIIADVTGYGIYFS